MDKKTLFGIVLIGVIMVAWMMYTGSVREDIPAEQKHSIETDTQQVAKSPIDTTLSEDKSNTVQPLTEQLGTFFEPFAVGQEQHITIHTDNYTAIISNKGGSIVRWTLKNFNKWDEVPAQLINYKESELYIKFTSIEAKKIDSRKLYFDVSGVDNNVINLTGDAQQDVYFTLDLGGDKKLVKKLTFKGNKYDIIQDITVDNLENVLKSGYTLFWGHNLNYQEANSVDESSYSKSIISMNGSIEDFEGADSEIETKEYTGIIDYVAVKTKYFTAAIIPQPWQKFDGTATFAGQQFDVKKSGKLKDFQIGINVPYRGGSQTNSFMVYIGPIDYKIVDAYGIEAIVDLGARYVIRPIGEYFMIPLFNMVHSFIPNYGISIIIFSILMKILLYPLSLKQVRNASYMKLLAPEIAKRKEKFKDDVKQQNMVTMEVYNEYGINPASGCLPLLVQMPILWALWRTLNGAIEMRQEPFILWITDLSRPDVLIGWGYSVLGMTHISGLALLMAVSMFIQQKMTITDPNQKAMVYMMPLMFLFMFSNFPSGLNLYYFVFNLLAIGQQVYVNNFSRSKLSLADLKKNPKKKEGWLAKQMKMAQEMQKSGGKSVPPAMQRYLDAQNKKNNPPTNSNNKSGNNRKKK
ncbi:MAG: membrane protein insertase YidC [Ignavibacteria bacterium]|jgi:YidC/Oxa1 family membrane protein insertase|nr:membrane protein insertase YidC [Ignavibacteria bacterium]